jgi:aminoglycoside phosphotransferase (APT) family kinase protein
LPGFKGPIAAEKTPTGQSNPTFILASPSGKYVLRKKPPGQLLKSAHQVDREYRVMKGLGSTDVPVPRMLLLCEDDGVIGTAFFLMEFVTGTVFWDPSLPELEKAQRTKLYDEQNRALAALHRPIRQDRACRFQPATATLPASATVEPSSIAPRDSTSRTWRR